ncbi:DUF624 domain-containing protein [Enterococcus nangangensis]|uniref:DUF624 domain-containing protein n=1 Tax=Enterococcus nangangensis TaxID=2559926 RepID=UPI0010F43399|nr:DUF624 domain-containing protein [Enterococcus nangangensis]
MGNQHEFTDGKMYKISARVYELLLLQLGFIITSSPLIFAFLFLEKVIDNVLLWGLFAIVLGPSLSAVVAALLTDHREEYAPLVLYFKKYRANFLDALKVTVPVVAIAVVFIVDIAWQIQTAYNFLAWFFLLALFLLGVYAIFAGVINVKFAFRLRDLLRLSAYYMFTQLKLTLKIASYLIITLALMYFVTDFLLILFTVVLIYLITQDFLPVLNDIQTKFVKKG